MNQRVTDSVTAGPAGTGRPEPAGDADLRERAELFVQFASTETHVLWVADLLPEPRMVYVSPAFETVWGYSPDQVYGRVFSWADAIHAEDAPRVLQAFEAWIAHPLARHYDMSYRIVRPDGGIRWVHDAAHVARMQGGRPARISGIAEDITLQMQALEALSGERDRLAHVMATAPSVIHSVTLGTDGRLHFDLGADRIAHLYGVSEDEARRDANAVFAQRLHPDDERVVHAAVKRSMATNTPWRVDYRILHPTQGERWVTGHSIPTRHDDGSITWVGTVTDITERKRTEQALQSSQAQLAAVFADLSEGLIICRPDGVILDWNRAAQQIYGSDADEHRTLPLKEFIALFELRTLAGEPLPPPRWPLARVLAGQTVHREAYRLHHRAQGWDKVCTYTGQLVRDAAGKPMLAMLLVSDFTERQRAEDEVRRLNAELEDRVAARTEELKAAVQDLEAFSYSVSHDLRAPLRAIDGFSQMLLDEHGAALPEDGRRYIGIVRETTQRMGQLIDDLLAFSRLGRLSLTRRTVDMNQLVAHVREQLATQEAGRTVTWQVADLPPCEGDLAMLRQVWINLLSNALKYSRRREIACIEIGFTQERGKPEYVVRDNGTGFDMQYAHKLFGVFERLHRAEDFEGSGVGLAIVQRILRRHDGDVRAEAVPDQGASFYFHVG